MISTSQDIVLNSPSTEVLQIKLVEVKDLNRKTILSAVVALLGLIIVLIGVGLIFSGTTPLALAASLIVLGVALFLCGFVLSLQFYRCEKIAKRQLEVAVSLINPQDLLKQLNQSAKDIETGVDNLSQQFPETKTLLEPAFNGALGELRGVLQQKQIILNTYIEDGSLLDDETLTVFREDIAKLGILVSHFLDLVRLNRSVIVSQQEVKAFCSERNILREDQEAVSEPFSAIQDRIIDLSLNSLGINVSAWTSELSEQAQSLSAEIEEEITANMVRLCSIFKELDSLKEGGLERLMSNLDEMRDRISVLTPTVASAVRAKIAEDNLRGLLETCSEYQRHLLEQRQDQTASLVVENNRISSNWQDFVALPERDLEAGGPRLFPGRKRLFQEFQHVGGLFCDGFRIDGTGEDVVSDSKNKIEEAAARRAIFDIQCLEQATSYEEFINTLDVIARSLTDDRISQRLESLLQDAAYCLPSCLNLLTVSEETPSHKEEESILGNLQKLGLDHYIPYPIRAIGESGFDYIRKQVSALLVLISDLAIQELSRLELSRQWLGQLKNRLGDLIEDRNIFEEGSGCLLNILQTLKKEKARKIGDIPPSALKDNLNRLEIQTASFDRIAAFREQKIQLTLDIGSASKVEEEACSLVEHLQKNEALWEARVEVEKSIAAAIKELQMLLVREHAARLEMEKEIEGTKDPVTGILSERGLILQALLLKSEKLSAELTEEGRLIQLQLAAERAKGYPGELTSKVGIDYWREEVERAKKLHREARDSYQELLSLMEKERDYWPNLEEFDWLTGSNLLVDPEAEVKDQLQSFSDMYLKMNEMSRFIMRSKQALLMREEELQVGELQDSCGKLLIMREDSSWERASGSRNAIVGILQPLEDLLVEAKRILCHLRSLGCPVLTLELSERVRKMVACYRRLEADRKILFPENDFPSTVDTSAAMELEFDTISQDSVED